MSKRILLIAAVIVIGFLGIVLYPVVTNKTVIAPTKESPNIPVVTKNHNSKDVPQVSVVASDFEVPWALAFLPDNSLIVTERPGRVRMITKEGNLLPEPLLTLNVVQQLQGEGGLLGIALHPNFSSNHYVYLYYTYADNNQQTRNRVSKFTLANNKLIDEKIIVNDIPGSRFHNGGRIKFGPDKFLYITTGDSEAPSLAQDKNATAGKILRVTDEGKAAQGNPFGNLTYSYGHRNPQGIAWDAQGNLWETEHGRSLPTGFDEINLITSGKNYGWDTIQGDETRSGMETPKLNSGANGTWAPAGAVFVRSSLFYSGLKGQTLYEAVTQNNQVTALKEHLSGEYGRLREVILGPDGMLYITTSNRDGRGSPKPGDDKILRVNPEKL